MWRIFLNYELRVYSHTTITDCIIAVPSNGSVMYGLYNCDRVLVLMNTPLKPYSQIERK